MARSLLAIIVGTGLLAAAAAARAAGDDAADLTVLKRQLEQVLEQNRDLQQRVGDLENQVRSARDEAQAARALAARPPAAPSAGAAASLPLGPARLQLLDVSLDVLSAAGFSSAEDETLGLLQAGGHDPHRRGFSLPAAELSFAGAVDPWLDGEAHVVYFLDPQGESRFELEEAFATTTRLPFGLEEHGLQLEFGTFLTEFGRINPTHPHAWNWLDQPVVVSRFFGGDGMRGPGVRAGWLLPLPWFSELHLGAQNAQGETLVSFLANEEVFDERPLGGRPFASAGTRSASDLVYLARWVNGFDLSDTWSGQIGLSGLTGPNATGPDARTWIYGSDAVLKWRPLSTDHGWPFVTLEAEVMGRRYEVDPFHGCAADTCDEPISLAGGTLDDWGAYAQVLWGFRRGWAAGLRYELASGSGESVGIFDGRSEDPFRDDRQRISPLLAWYPSEFSRVRLQYDYDRADFLAQDDAHTVWLALEFLFGSHPAHRF